MGRITDMNNVKIFVLYLMWNIHEPLDYTTINAIVMKTDYVLFLDFVDAFHELLDLGLIEVVAEKDGEKYYGVTNKGKLVAEQLKTDIRPTLLEESLIGAMQYLDFTRRGVTVTCDVEPVPIDRTFNLKLTYREKDKILLQTTLNVDTEYRAQRIRTNFHEHPENIYRGLMALLAGNVNYLFDK